MSNGERSESATEHHALIEAATFNAYPDQPAAWDEMGVVLVGVGGVGMGVGIAEFEVAIFGMLAIVLAVVRAHIIWRVEHEQ